MRVNARLDETTQQQLQYLTEVTGHSVSQVVRESVAWYYGQVRSRRPPSRLSAMIGKGDSGRSDVASNVKAHLTDIIQRKHGLVPLQALPDFEPAQPVKLPKRRTATAG